MGILKLNVKVCSIGQSGFDGGALAHVKATWWPVQFTHFVSLTLACTCGKPTSKRIASHRGFFFRPIHRVAVVYGSRCYWKTAGWCGEDLQQLAYHIYLVKVRCSCFCHAILIWQLVSAHVGSDVEGLENQQPVSLTLKRIKLAFHGLVSWLFNKKTYASIDRNLTWKILVSPLAPNCQNLQTNNLRFQNDTNPSGARNSFSLARHSHELHGVEFLALHFAKFRKSARGFWSQVTALPQDLWAWWQRVAAILAGLIRLRSCQVDM